MWTKDTNFDPVHDDPDYASAAMDEAQLEQQSRLLIELGEPETWLETMLRASRRSAEHEGSIGNEELASRWRRLVKGLEYASAMTDNDPIAGEPMDSAEPGDADQPTGNTAHT